ncbi:hypothetical protein CCYN2B_310012 [Capnocytophaga cynodegmi]|uniref:Uncharacterized protein n=1 Tax=Capnocytophaga cynodegmi TaxID=28189 RepID=A0A0B7H926_9FLAO|nr:hypothetical protein CCYN2B_310012 [Capnocytophaga cynodegmi]
MLLIYVNSSFKNKKDYQSHIFVAITLKID